MVDLNFKARAEHFVPLSLVKRIASGSSETLEDLSYIGEDNVKAIREMQIKTCNVINNFISNDTGNYGKGLRETLKVTNDPYFKEFQ